MKTQRTKDRGFGTGCKGRGDKVKQNRPGNAHTSARTPAPQTRSPVK